MKIKVLRLSHRIERDKRLSTHVALAARAFGCSEIVYSGEKDSKLENSINNVVKNWGGNFKIKYVKNWRKFLKEQKFLKIHLTMYGINLPDIINEIRQISKLKGLLVVVGSQKVEVEVYELSDYNLAVGNSPHSEVSSLAIFLHELFKGKELNKKFKNAKLRIIPQKRGKNVIKVS